MKPNLFIFLLLLIMGTADVQSQQSKRSFLQTVKTDITLPSNAGQNVIKLFSVGQQVVAVTSRGVFRYQDGNWMGKQNGLDWRNAAVDKQGKVWLSSVDFIQQENTVEKRILILISYDVARVLGETLIKRFWCTVRAYERLS